MENEALATRATNSSKLVNFDIVTTTPGYLKVIRRNGTLAHFDANKIVVALTKAFLAVEGDTAAGSPRINETVSKLVQRVTETFLRRMPSGGTIHIEDIQDQVELSLMRSGEHKIARAYVLYREERRKIRDQEQDAANNGPQLSVTLNDGKVVPLDINRLTKLIESACVNLTDVSSNNIIEDTQRNLFDKVPVKEVSKALIMSARVLIEKEPNYSYVAARLLLDEMRSEALTFLGIQDKATFEEMTSLYEKYLKAYLTRGIELELLDSKLKTYNLAKLAAAIKPERDLQFTYLGLQTLYDRYFIHSHGTRFELPQAFFMRVAMGLALNENNKEERAIEFYNLLSSFDFMSSTPTLFNSGTLSNKLRCGGR